MQELNKWSLKHPRQKLIGWCSLYSFLIFNPWGGQVYSPRHWSQCWWRPSLRGGQKGEQSLCHTQGQRQGGSEEVQKLFSGEGRGVCPWGGTLPPGHTIPIDLLPLVEGSVSVHSFLLSFWTKQEIHLLIRRSAFGRTKRFHSIRALF